MNKEIDKKKISKNKKFKPTKYYFKKFNNIKYKYKEEENRKVKIAENNTINPILIEIIVNDRMGQKVRVKCKPEDKISDLKKLTSAHIGTKWQKWKFQKGYAVLNDNLTLDDYEIKEGSMIELYYN